MKRSSILRLFLASFVALPLPGAEPSLQLTLPAVWHGAPGVPISVYFDNMVLTEHPENFRFEVKCDIGTTEARRWTVNPEDKDTGEHLMEVVVKDTRGQELERKRTKLLIAPRNAGADRELRLLIVGDSLTHATKYPNEIARLLSTAGNPRWTMLGTHQPASAAPGVAHEGYGGWTWAAFLTKFDPKPPEATAGPPAKKSTSPFVFADAGGKGVLDVPRYIRQNCGNQPPDVVMFLLGINDCFRADPNDRAAMEKTINAALDNAEELVTAFHKAAPKAVFAVGLTTPPNSREEGFEASYHGNFHRWDWKRIQHRLVQRMLERFGDRQMDNLHLVATELNLDPVDGYPNDNGVHPNASGYAQIGASFYSWLKVWLAGRL